MSSMEKEAPGKTELLQGILDVVILKTPLPGALSQASDCKP
jgi:hypothetical protein